MPIFFVRMRTLIEELLFVGNPSHGQSTSYSAIFKASNDSFTLHSLLFDKVKKHNFEYLMTVFRSFWKISIWGKISQKHTYSFGHSTNYPSPPGMHAPPRPAPGGNGCPGPPQPRKFSTLPRPAPKITPGQESGQMFLHHQKILGVKNFWPVFLAPKVLFEDMWPTITIPISPNDS